MKSVSSKIHGHLQNNVFDLIDNSIRNISNLTYNIYFSMSIDSVIFRSKFKIIFNSKFEIGYDPHPFVYTYIYLDI